ncbi:hypothetical protein K1T71_000317 [Dendrolimus kikuchii]|uniref:Uncharacterized protein n=1 Tax=Dendrolimus kikuchii TaxID=765133 RepID=A0ACC1DJJ4_9NEOP|nr:hypothetical protein K1T71_000317 [Dendrolimus kikuchii]
MYTIHEGEIIIKEKYGSTTRERHYVKPAEQENIVVLDERKINNLKSWFTKIFLPQGYPDSVSKDYIAYQIWDTAQAFCSTITGTIATQEVLRGVGVGDTSATPLAATITWVIKDGCGHIGRILFAYSHGTYLDAYSKKWRLYADTLNDAAMCIEIALPLFKKYTTFVLCISTAMKAIVGVAGGATRAAMTQHHAIRGNLADVSAKDSAQETAVNLVASFTALLIITLFGNSLLIFALMMVLHIAFNYCAVRAVCLRTLNEPRFLQLISRYLKEEMIASPCEINRTEPIIFYQLGPNLLDLQLCGFQIKLGHSIKHLINQQPKVDFIKNAKKMYDGRNYIILPNISDRNMYVLISDEANTGDILCSYFHAVLLSIITCAINDVPLAIYQNTPDLRPFTKICHTLQSAEWSRDPMEGSLPYPGFTYNPSTDLIKYVIKIVDREWYRIRAGLAHTGWDLNNHLLMADEWRISTSKLLPVNIGTDVATTQIDSIIEATSIIVSCEDIIEELGSEDVADHQTFSTDPNLPGVKIIDISQPTKVQEVKESDVQSQRLSLGRKVKSESSDTIKTRDGNKK